MLPWINCCGLLACVAGGIVGARNNVLTAESLKTSGEAARRMGSRGFAARDIDKPPKFYSARLQYRQLSRLAGSWLLLSMMMMLIIIIIVLWVSEGQVTAKRKTLVFLLAIITR